MKPSDVSDWLSSLWDARANGHVWSWRDSGELNAMRRSLLDADLSGLDEDVLHTGISLSEELGGVFEQMDRMRYAGECYSLSVRMMAERFVRFGDDSHQMAQVLCKAVKARNYYADDPCEDLKQAADLYMAEASEDVIAFAFSEKRILNHDPVEATDAYLSVIDDVEEELEQQTAGTGRPVADQWRVKKELLKERGLNWRSPADCNPNVRFA